MLNFQRFAASLLLILSCSAIAEEVELVVAVEKNGDGFTVSASATVQAPVPVTWAVLTDFNHMASILSNLTTSKVLQHNGNSLRILQEGRAWYGPFFYTFSSERDVRLEPMKRILSQQLTGTTKHFASQMELSPKGTGTQLRYHAEIIPGSSMARTFGRTFVQHEVEEQLSAMLAEISRQNAL
ncbi:MAG: SRPBCC family protein [Betaproteobacteria bacterium]